MPWLESVDCDGKRVPIDLYIEKYGLGLLPRKYERALERYYRTKDKKVMMQRALRGRKVVVQCPDGDIEEVEKDTGDAVKKIASIASRVARRFVADSDDEARLKSMKQWTTGDGSEFRPAGNTVQNLPPGYYECGFSPMCGYFLNRIPCNTEDLIRFPEASTTNVVNEIKKFWNKYDDFKRAGLTFKRGLLMYGPPGTGKSCAVKIAISDVYERGGVAIKMEDPHVFLECVRMLRAIQPVTPLVVIMEDIDSLLERFNQTTVLNLLDGVEGLEWVVFLATTNYPEKLGGRIINRPSRFDRRFEVPALGAKSREIYLKHLLDKYMPDKPIDLERWVADTEGMSIAHLKELFVGVMILEDDYEAVTKMLREMHEVVPTSGEDEGKLATVFDHDECHEALGEPDYPVPCCGSYDELRRIASMID